MQFLQIDLENYYKLQLIRKVIIRIYERKMSKKNQESAQIVLMQRIKDSIPANIRSEERRVGKECRL